MKREKYILYFLLFLTFIMFITLLFGELNGLYLLIPIIILLIILYRKHINTLIGKIYMKMNVSH